MPNFWNIWIEGGEQSRRFLRLRVFPPQLSCPRRQKCNSQVEEQKTVTYQEIVFNLENYEVDGSNTSLVSKHYLNIVPKYTQH